MRRIQVRSWLLSHSVETLRPRKVTTLSNKGRKLQFYEALMPLFAGISLQWSQVVNEVTGAVCEPFGRSPKELKGDKIHLHADYMHVCVPSMIWCK